jgi:NADH dehydrogenase FAD-containing subunit
MLMGQIKAYVDARVDEKIADALENRGVNVRFGVSVPEMTSQQLSELDTFIKNRVAEALRQSSL